ncbi:hypothetical protein ACHAW5_009025 [Stephanodiscus triporus]|uniref:Uncharacterized protein n=1 Tax=Stephanodiscus triporus TaxID=2934178 RepID=A0ABD3QJI6_9STRA
MRPFEPAPKNASANRIRERYLHQLGLQRGGDPLTAPHLPSNHVVVISGLPSLPEDRATTEHGMESHDFSISKQTQHSITTRGSTDENSCEDYDDMQSDSESAHKTARKTGETLQHMALAYPAALLKVPPPVKPTPPPSPHSRPVPWRNTSSQSACILLNNDHDSVSSVGTSTTAESSAMISRDWGAHPHTTSAGVSISTQGGESPTSAPGVYFQCGNPRLLLVGNSQGGNCPASLLAHELNRFNIDSDCEASVTSTSIAEDRMMDEDDASVDDTIESRASVASHLSTGSTKSQLSATRNIRGLKKKIGKTQRLMDRAAAHERILRIRSDHSQKMRADVVHAQRVGNPAPTAPWSSIMPQESMLTESPCVLPNCPNSIPLVHLNHSGLSQVQSFGDTGRTPTASNCSDLRSNLRKLRELECCVSLPEGVHISAGTEMKASPLWSHPQLASRIPTPPPSGIVLQASCHNVTSNPLPIPMPCLAKVGSRGGEDFSPSSPSSLQHTDHQATVDDVMEVAMALSSLSGMRTGSIPRIR